MRLSLGISVCVHAIVLAALVFLFKAVPEMHLPEGVYSVKILQPFVGSGPRPARRRKKREKGRRRRSKKPKEPPKKEEAKIPVPKKPDAKKEGEAKKEAEAKKERRGEAARRSASRSAPATERASPSMRRTFPSRYFLAAIERKVSENWFSAVSGRRGGAHAASSISGSMRDGSVSGRAARDELRQRLLRPGGRASREERGAVSAAAAGVHRRVSRHPFHVRPEGMSMIRLSVPLLAMLCAAAPAALAQTDIYLKTERAGTREGADRDRGDRGRLFARSVAARRSVTGVIRNDLDYSGLFETMRRREPGSARTRERSGGRDFRGKALVGGRRATSSTRGSSISRARRRFSASATGSAPTPRRHRRPYGERRDRLFPHRRARHRDDPHSLPAGRREASKNLYVVDYDGFGERRITKDEIVMSPLWLDGNRFCYSSDRRSNWDCYLVDLAKGTKYLLTQWRGINIAGSYFAPRDEMRDDAEREREPRDLRSRFDGQGSETPHEKPGDRHIADRGRRTAPRSRSFPIGAARRRSTSWTATAAPCGVSRGAARTTSPPRGRRTAISSPTASREGNRLPAQAHLSRRARRGDALRR